MEQAWLLMIGGVIAVILLLLFLGKSRSRAESPEPSPQAVRNVGRTAEKPVTATRPVSNHREIEEATYLDDESTIGGDFYTEVATLLKQVLAEHPDRQDLRLKLLDVYFDSGNGDAFIREAGIYRDSLADKDSSDWKAVKEKGATLAPEHELFRQQKKAAAAVQPASGEEKAPDKEYRRFGDIPEARVPLQTLAEAYSKLRSGPQFFSQLDRELIRTAGRPAQMLQAQRFSQKLGGAQIFVKREDLVGRHPRMRVHLMGQAWIAKRLGKKKVIYAANGGEEAVLAAQAAARAGIKCVIYISVQRGQYREAHTWQAQMMGAEVRETMAGHESGDIRYAALEDWLHTPGDSFMMLNLAAGPHPYPTMTTDLQSVIGRECLRQVIGNTGKPPRALFARAGQNTDAIGFVEPFLGQKATEIHLVGALDREESPGAPKMGDSDPYHLLYSSKQIRSAMSVLEGMEFPRVEREHALLKSTGRITYGSARLKDATKIINEVAQAEGMILPLETAHVFAYAAQYAKRLSSSDTVVILLAEQQSKDLLGLE